jgi:hypothetical protein
MKLKWTKAAIEAYKKTGEQMKGLGFRALREVKDPDCQTVLTFWSGLDGCIIQQTWTDTGDVVLYRTVSEDELEGMLSAGGSESDQGAR